MNSAKPPFPHFVLPLDPINCTIDRCKVGRLNASKRYLIMRNGAHGDVLMATPILAALRKAEPDCHITWIVEAKEKQAIDCNPFVDELLLWNSSEVKKPLRHLNLIQWLIMMRNLKRAFRERSYDVFISYQPEEWAIIPRLCGAKIRIGIFDTFRQFNNHAPTSSLTHLYTDAFTWRELPEHRTDQYLLPLKTLELPQPINFRMSAGITMEDQDKCAQFLAQHGIDENQRVVVIAPMTTWPSRCWPSERYMKLANSLEGDHRIVLIGNAREKPVIEKIAREVDSACVVAAGVLSFREMMALIARANLLISGDTGPMHVAAAMGTSYVALFGSTPVVGRAPKAGAGSVISHDVPCGPCDQKDCPNKIEPMLCMNLITVDEVLHASRRLMNSVII